MDKMTIKTTVPEDTSALQGVLDGTGLFPSEMLPDMMSPAFAGDTDALWLTCHFEGKPIGFCYTMPEALAEGT